MGDVESDAGRHERVRRSTGVLLAFGGEVDVLPTSDPSFEIRMTRTVPEKHKWSQQ